MHIKRQKNAKRKTSLFLGKNVERLRESFSQFSAEQDLNLERFHQVSFDAFYQMNYKWNLKRLFNLCLLKEYCIKMHAYLKPLIDPTQ